MQTCCLLPLIFCLAVVAENITLSSDHGSIWFEAQEVNDWIIDQIFWKNFNQLFPHAYYYGAEVSVQEMSHNHYHYTLTINSNAYPNICELTQFSDGTYRCPYCPETKVATAMYNHIRRHLGITVHCPVCGQGDKQSSSCYRHFNEHHKI